MTSFFSDLEAQLRTAAHQRTAGAPATPGTPGTPEPGKPGRPRRRWLAGGARLLPVAAAVAVTLAVVVGALVLLGHGHPPARSAPASHPPSGGMAAVIGSTPPKLLAREFGFMAAATKQVLASPACRPRQPTGVQIIHGTPGRSLLSILGVLRRPATPADKLSPDLLGSGLGDSVYAGHLRRARVLDGTSYYVAPARDDPAARFPSAACFAKQAAALELYLPKIPAALRAPTRELQTRLIAYDRHLASTPPQDALCFVTTSRNSGTSECGVTAAQIRAGQGLSGSQDVFSGVVPDGVASVTLRFPPSSPRPASSVTAAVRGNVYIVHVAGAGKSSAVVVPTIIWRAADGHVLKTINEPNPAKIARLCRQRPVTCLAASGAAYADGSSSSSSSTSAAAAPAHGGG